MTVIYFKPANTVINSLSSAPPPSMGQHESCPNGPLLALVAVLIFDH